MTSYYQTPSGGLSLTPVTAAQIAVATGTWSPTAVYNNYVVATPVQVAIASTATGVITMPEIPVGQFVETTIIGDQVVTQNLGTYVPEASTMPIPDVSFGAGWDAIASIGKAIGDIGSIVGGTLGGSLGAGISGLTGGVEFGTGILGTPAPPLTSTPYEKVVAGAPTVIKETVTNTIHDVVVKIVEIPIKLAEAAGDATSKGLFGIDMKTLLILGIGAIILTRK